MTNTLTFIEEQIAFHHAQLEKYMIARVVVLEAQKRAPKEEPKKLEAPKRKGSKPVHGGEPMRRAIIDLLSREAKPMKPGEMREVLGGANVNRQAVWNAVYLLHKEGRIVRDGFNYSLPVEPIAIEVAA